MRLRRGKTTMERRETEGRGEIRGDLRGPHRDESDDLRQAPAAEPHRCYITAVESRSQSYRAQRRPANQGEHAMPVDQSTTVISHAIQLAIAPVFLLTGIAALLGVMATRLGRVIDRMRSFEQSWPNLDAKARAAARVELGCLERRRRMCSWSINYCTSGALLVCLVIVTLFMEEFFGTSLKWLGGAFFVSAMVALICALVCFLREVYAATHATKIELMRLK